MSDMIHEKTLYEEFYVEDQVLKVLEFYVEHPQSLLPLQYALCSRRGERRPSLHTTS